MIKTGETQVKIIMAGVTLFSFFIQMVICCKGSRVDSERKCGPMGMPCKVYFAQLNKHAIEHNTIEPDEQTTIGYDYGTMSVADTPGSTVQPPHSSTNPCPYLRGEHHLH